MRAFKTVHLVPYCIETGKRCWPATREQKKTDEFESWQRMIVKAEAMAAHPKRDAIKDAYTVCDRWLDFDGFLADMGRKETGKFLDRIDRYKPFSKTNCRWSTRGELNRHGIKTPARIIRIGGKEMRQSDWARYLNIPLSTLRYKVRTGTFRKFILERLSSCAEV